MTVRAAEFRAQVLELQPDRLASSRRRGSAAGPRTSAAASSSSGPEAGTMSFGAAARTAWPSSRRAVQPDHALAGPGPARATWPGVPTGRAGPAPAAQAGGGPGRPGSPGSRRPAGDVCASYAQPFDWAALGHPLVLLGMVKFPGNLAADRGRVRSSVEARTSAVPDSSLATADWEVPMRAATSVWDRPAAWPWPASSRTSLTRSSAIRAACCSLSGAQPSHGSLA